MPQHTDRDTFARRLRRLRAAAGLTQLALAEASGLSRDYVQALETGRRPDPSWSTVRRLAAALGVGVEDFTRHD